ncbi:MAG: hypothetical protein M3N46_11805 [Actinomycetota bacterium]|nr:hypothetical protein [Actinomycetota bacterium]
MAAVQTFDFSPLTAPVDKSAVAALRRESITENVQPAAIDDRFVFWMCLITFVFDAALVVFIDTGFLALWVKIGVTAIMGSMGLFLFYGVVYSIYRLSVRWTQFFRAKEFATANKMTYAVTESKPTWDSLLFSSKAARSGASNVFTATSEPVFEAGNYYYENWSQKKLIRTDWGYAVVDLGRPVPPLMLRSTGRRSAKRWALGAYSRNPILPLGAYADRDFRLYCTAGAEDEARRLFTPELIAALRKVGRSVDVEVSGNFMFVYSTRRFPFPRPGSVRAVFSAISLVGSLSHAA